MVPQFKSNLPITMIESNSFRFLTNSTRILSENDITNLTRDIQEALDELRLQFTRPNSTYNVGQDDGGMFSIYLIVEKSMKRGNEGDNGYSRH